MYYVGQAKDIHRLKSSKSKVTLGGFSFDCDYKIIAVSDGDVVLHALANAILGASQNGDIGMYFPDTDSRNKGLNSQTILSKALLLASDKDYEFVNADLTIVCDKIMINPIREYISNSLKTILGSDKINVKATRFEQNKSLIMVDAIVMLKKGK